MGKERKGRLETDPLSVAERLRKATQDAPLLLREKMKEALAKLDRGLPPARDGAVLNRRVDF